MNSTQYLDLPFRRNSDGRTATATRHQHIRNLILQTLFTNPGERVNRPDFGCGLRQLLFMPNSDALATATEHIVQGSLQRWLSHVIRVDRIRVTNDNERVIIDIVYTRKDTGERVQDTFATPGTEGDGP